MFSPQELELLFITWAFLFQVLLIVHFSLRKWAFDHFILTLGWIVYAMGIPAFMVSLLLFLGNMNWSLWIGGMFYLLWAIYGYVIEYMMEIKWRNPVRWAFFGPYVLLYLSTIMFYWWPLALLSRTLWYGYAILFIISTLLNVLSHKSEGVGIIMVIQKISLHSQGS